jgi:hypothetical protein
LDPQASATTARDDSDKIETTVRGMNAPFALTVAAAEKRLGKR